MAINNGSKYLTDPSSIPVTSDSLGIEKELGEWVSYIDISSQSTQSPYDGRVVSMDFGNDSYGFSRNQGRGINMSKSFDDMVEFTRASTATYLTYDGSVGTSAVDEPRIENSLSFAKGVLIESEKTNYVPYSEPTTSGKPIGSTSNWAGTPTTMRGLTFDRYIKDGGSISTYTDTDISTGAWSAYFYDDGLYTTTVATDMFRFELTGTSAGNCYLAIAYNPSTSAFSSTKGNGTWAYVVEDLGEGFYRIMVSGQVPSGDIAQGRRIALYATVGAQWWISGMQVENGSIPSSYIKTSGVATSRSEDFATLDIDVIPSATSSCLYCEVYIKNTASTSGIIEMDASSGGEDGRFRIFLDSSDRVVVQYTAGDGEVNSLSLGTLTDFTVSHKIAASVNGESGLIYGSLDGTTSSATLASSVTWKPSVCYLGKLSSSGFAASESIIVSTVNMYAVTKGTLELSEMTS